MFRGNSSNPWPAHMTVDGIWSRWHKQVAGQLVWQRAAENIDTIRHVAYGVRSLGGIIVRSFQRDFHGNFSPPPPPPPSREETRTNPSQTRLNEIEYRGNGFSSIDESRSFIFFSFSFSFVSRSILSLSLSVCVFQEERWKTRRGKRVAKQQRTELPWKLLASLIKDKLTLPEISARHRDKSAWPGVARCYARERYSW